MPQCHLCPKNHQLKYCQMFVALSPGLRRKTVLHNNMCENCLAHSHLRKDCESSGRCRFCGKDHHSMLHTEPPKTDTPREMTTKLDPEVQATPTNPQTKVPLVNAISRLAIRPTSVNIAPLIRALVIHKHHQEFLTFMVDTKAKYSKISWKAAAKFPFLKIEKNPAMAPYAVLILKSEGPRYRFTLALTDNLGVEIPESLSNMQIRDHFSHLVPLAHDNFHDEANVDGIISGSSWEKIKKQDVIQPHAHLPKAQASTFGWVIYGQWNGCDCDSHAGRSIIRC